STIVAVFGSSDVSDFELGNAFASSAIKRRLDEERSSYSIIGSNQSQHVFKHRIGPLGFVI
ncbi:353_t:CDS:1, partial [Cetraspora pellucida]